MVKTAKTFPFEQKNEHIFGLKIFFQRKWKCRAVGNYLSNICCS